MTRRTWHAERDPEPARWLSCALTASETVASVVPTWFQAYARLSSLPVADELVALQDVLARHTRTPQTCWFAMWEGHSTRADALRGMPTFGLRGLAYYLFRGAVGDLRSLAEYLGTAGLPDHLAASAVAGGAVHVPTNWWPEDRAWVAGWHIDAAYVVVGGSAELVGELVASSAITACAIGPTEPLAWG